MRQWVANIDLEIAVSLINHTLVEFDEDKNDQKLDVRYLISFQRQRNERLTEEIFDRYKKEMKNKAKQITSNLWPEDYLLRQLMTVRNRAVIEMRTAYRFAYDQESIFLIDESMQDLQDKLDEYIENAVELNKSNSE